MTEPAASAEFIDLDAVVAPDIQVQLGGDKYALPGDPPTETLLRLVQLSKRAEEATGDEENVDQLLAYREEMDGLLEELFAMRQEIEPGTLQLTDTQTGELLSRLFDFYFSGKADDKPEGEGDEKPEARPTRPTSQRARRQTSRSSGSRRTPAGSASSKS